MRLSDFFSFNKNDRIVGLWLVAVIACGAGIVAFGDDNNSEELADAVDAEQVPRSAFSKGGKGDGYYEQGTRIVSPKESGDVTLHPFDLNTATPDELLSLGFTEREVRSVMNYRAKGGVYRQKEQMSRISGMTKGEYDRLAPYFRVGEDYRPAADFVKMPERGSGYHEASGIPEYQYSEKKSTETASEENPSEAEVLPKLRAGETVPINASDTTALKRIPGVGSYYAKTIVNYREKLGGFYAVEQLNDLQFVPADIQDWLVFDPVPLRKLKVNSLPINRLIVHPYITFYQAQAIKDHIRKNGALKSIRELALNKNFSDSDLERLEPYLDYE
ncbi:MAG: helix-hairpin-helix domain-containing protein [Prevotella sp.]|nr:helix-hairpin-helix domain-containing protein [Prevotella sp.]